MAGTGFQESNMVREATNLSRTHRQPGTRVEKMTLKDVCPNAFIGPGSKLKRAHASFDNNMPLAVRNDVDAYVQKVRAEGYFLRRMPSVDLLPIDLERRRTDKEKKKQALGELNQYFA